MTFLVLSGMFNGLVSLGLGLLLYSRAPKNPKHQTYGTYCASIAVWGFAYAVWQFASSESMALRALQVLMLGATCLPITHLHHAVTLLDQASSHRRLILIGYLVTGVLGVMVFTPYCIDGVYAAMGFPYWPNAGPVFTLYLLWLILCVGYASYLFYKAYHGARGRERFHYLVLMVAYLIGYAGGATNFPIWYGIPLPPYGTILVSVYAIAVASLLIHYRLLDFSFAIERSLPYVFGMAVFVMPAFAIFLYAQQVFFGSVHLLFSTVVVAVVGGFMFLGTRIMGNMRSALANMLFRERYAMYDAMTQFSKSLVTNLDLRSLVQDIVEALGRLMGIRHVTLYLLNPEQNVFVPVSHYGTTLSDQTSRIPGHATLPQFLLTSRDLVYCPVGEPRDASKMPSDVAEALTRLGGEICLPLINKDALLGFCVLGQRANDEEYSPTDLALLRMVSQEAAIALENARLCEELKRSQALVRRTDRLRSLETMAGGLAHEIRNPLTSIKAFVDLAPERRHDEEFLLRFSHIVKDDVARIERLTREILDYARPTDPYLQRESLNEILESCLYSVRTRSIYRSISFQTEFAEDVPPVWVDRQQMKQVFLNLVLNGLEAMTPQPQGGVLTVRTYRMRKGDREERVCVEVSDTGPGIAPSDLEHIFDPFFTTKHHSSEHEGTGLGLAIAHQIVEEHHGMIEVTSEPGHGSTFVVTLPAWHADRSPAAKPDTTGDQHHTSHTDHPHSFAFPKSVSLQE